MPLIQGRICLGRGTQPTVTDANLALGRLDTDRFLGGSVSLDRPRAMEWLEKAKGNIDTVENFAAGILRIIETSMEKAIRVISVEKGYDPRDFTPWLHLAAVVPLHGAALAQGTSSLPRVLIPALPGALSAVGILLADTMREYSRTVMLPVGADLEASFQEIERQGLEEFTAEGIEGICYRSVDLRWLPGPGLRVERAFWLRYGCGLP